MNGEVFAARFDQALRRLHPYVKSSDVIRDVYDELVRLRRDLAGIETELPPTDVYPTRSTTGVRGYSDRPQNHQGAHAGKERGGMRHCPRHDDCAGAWLPVSQFDIKNRATESLRSWCRACTLAYQRERYARVGTKVVTVEVLEGDACVGRDCPRCGRPFLPGQRVQGDDLHHENCRK